MTGRTSPTSIAQVAAAAVHGTSSVSLVGETLQGLAHDDWWLAQQHERDLAVLDRCEEQMLDDAGRCDG